MLRDEKNIDRLFKDKLLAHEEEMPAFVWSNVSDALDKKGHAKKMHFWRAVAASVVVFISFTIGYYYTGILPEKNHLSAQQIEEIEQVQLMDENLNNSIKELVANVKGNSSLKNYKQNISTAKQDATDNSMNQTIRSKNAMIVLSVVNEKSKLPENFIQNTYKKHNFIENENQPEEAILLKSSMMEANVYAQTDTYKPVNLDFAKVKTDSWIVGGYFSPVYSYRVSEIINPANDLKSLMEYDASTANKDSYDEFEKGTFSIASGLSVEYMNKNRWGIQSGIYLATLGQVTENVSDAVVQDMQNLNAVFSTSAGNIQVNKGQASSLNSNSPIDLADDKSSDLLQNFEYLEVPLNIKYKLIDDRFSMNVLAGLSTNILMKNRAYIQNDKTKYEIGRTENINQFIYSSNVGVGMQYGLTKNISMNVEPVFKYSLVSLNKDYPINYRPYYVTVFTGLTYKF